MIKGIILFISVFSLTFSTLMAGGNLDPQAVIPVNEEVKIGRLDNGLVYYIQKNEKPKDRAELRLVVNAGSVLEDDDQQGLAHFVEHMAFNGTESFARNELVDYLESVGVGFGPDINAYTSFDETVYQLQIPTDSLQIVQTAFKILEEWAHKVSFEDTEIDRERGVVIEEWRLRRGADARMRDQQYPIIFHDSRYAERLPIGKPEILKNFSYKTLKDFYKKWYRPDLMAVIAVGDFDQKYIEDLIIENFSKLPVPTISTERPVYEIPDHQETFYAIASDKEATGYSVSVYHKMDIEDQSHVSDYRRMLIERLYNTMLNRRFQEIIQQSQPPILYGWSGNGGLVRTKQFYALGAAALENGIEQALEVLLRESERVRKYGFTQTELDREKSQMLRRIEKAYKEKNKSDSEDYAEEIIRNFLENEPMPGIGFEYEMQNVFIPEITLEEVNQIGRKWLTATNRVVLVDMPEKENAPVPQDSELAAVFDKIASEQIDPYQDLASQKPFFPFILKPGKIVSEKEIPEINVWEWKLSNGIKVVLKPTDFKNDEIRFTAFSDGGTSVVPDKDYLAALTATNIIRYSGLSDFTMIDLQNMLAGKLVSVTPYIGELEEGIMGSGSPVDMETMFQLIYMYYNYPRIDSTAFQSYTFRLSEFMKDRDANPESAFQDTIQVTMSKSHYRQRPWKPEMLNELDMMKSFEIYRDRFADAGDFTFIFVGNFSPDTLRPFVETYLASLTDLEGNESWKDNGIRTPSGVISKTVHRGIEPKASVQIHFSGDFEWSAMNDYQFRSMVSVLNLKLRESLREDLGGTYGVSVSSHTARYPDPTWRIIVSFGCDPARVEELKNVVLAQIDSLKNHNVADLYITKVKEIQNRNREKSERENNFWVSKLETYYYYGWDPREIINYDRYINSFNADMVRINAALYFDLKNYASFVLYPESTGSGN